MKEMRNQFARNKSQLSSAARFQRLFKFIDKDMILTKLTYLLWGGLVTTYMIYFNPFYVSIGIPKSKVGVITGIPYAMSVIAAPFWGILTDYAGHQRIISIVLCLCSALCISSLPLIASAVGETVKTANDTILYRNSIANETGFVCNDGICNNVSQKQIITNSLANLDHQIINGDTMFYTFVIVMALGSVFFSCVDGYIEAIAIKTIRASPSGAEYGTQRVYGSVGAGINTYINGVLLDNFTLKDMSPFAIIFFFYPIFPILLIPMVLLLTRQRKAWIETSDSKLHVETYSPHSTGTTNEKKESIRNELCSLFRQVDIIMFMITVLVAGLSYSMVCFKVFLINEQMVVSKSEISLALSVESISNIVVFFGISRFIRLLGGPIPTIIFSLLCYCIRHILMSYTKSYCGIVLLQGLSGFSFGSIWCSFMEYIHKISPSKIKTTMIVLVQCVHYGLARFLGNILGGVLYGMFDATRLVRWNGIMCGIWSCVLVLYYSIRRYQNQMKNVPVAACVDQTIDHASLPLKQSDAYIGMNVVCEITAPDLAVIKDS